MGAHSLQLGQVHRRSSGMPRVSRTVSCVGPKSSPRIQQPEERPAGVGSAIAGLRFRRPQAQQAEAECAQEAPAAAAQAPASPLPEQPFQPGLTTRIKRWMPWSPSIPLASTLGRSASFSDEDVHMADGMAAALPSERGSWYTMGRWRGAAARQHPQLEGRPVAVDHAALQLLRQRVISGSAPGERLDGFKLGLVIEGGGMRGCVSGGALQAMTELGVRSAFDAVYGSSAGAINATFFLSGQRDGVHIYHDHIATDAFIDIRRLLARRPGLPPALNLKYLLEHVIEAVVPLDYDSVLSSPVPLKVVASCLDTLRPVLLENFESKDDLRACLRASATVPEVAGGPVAHRGRRLVDAAVFEAVPFRSAIADGCTHVLALCTRPAPVRRSYLDQALSDALETGVKRALMSPDYMVPAWQAEMEYLVKDGVSQDDMLLRALDEDAAALPWFAGSHVYPVYPNARGSSFSPICTDVPTLKGGVAEGRRAVLTVMRAVLGDVLDFSPFEAAANIVPLARRSEAGRARSERLWRRYMVDADFSSHG